MKNKDNFCKGCHLFGKCDLIPDCCQCRDIKTRKANKKIKKADEIQTAEHQLTYGG
jgi:hypothetical protein